MTDPSIQQATHSNNWDYIFSFSLQHSGHDYHLCDSDGNDNNNSIRSLSSTPAHAVLLLTKIIIIKPE